MNSLTPKGLELIKSHEGLRLNAYPDPGAVFDGAAGANKTVSGNI